MSDAGTRSALLFRAVLRDNEEFGLRVQLLLGTTTGNNTLEDVVAADFTGGCGCGVRSAEAIVVGATDGCTGGVLGAIATSTGGCTGAVMGATADAGAAGGCGAGAVLAGLAVTFSGFGNCTVQ